MKRSTIRAESHVFAASQRIHALLASAGPAWRAARVPPSEALRE